MFLIYHRQHYSSTQSFFVHKIKSLLTTQWMLGIFLKAHLQVLLSICCFVLFWSFLNVLTVMVIFVLYLNRGVLLKTYNDCFFNVVIWRILLNIREIQLPEKYCWNKFLDVKQCVIFLLCNVYQNKHAYLTSSL